MPIPDKFHNKIQKLIDQHQPNSPEELQQLLDSLIGKSLDEFDTGPLSEAEQAKELVWEAYDLPTDKGRRRAKKALQLDPDCIEAYEYLGNSYQYYHKAKPYYEKAIEIGRRTFGGDFLKQNKGHFWLVTETRPFMRCLHNLAECHFHSMQTQQSVELWKEMLELNPNDNQGIRYNLLAALLELQDLKTYARYRKKYPEEGAFMHFNDALKAFMEKGESATSDRYLKLAVGNNQYIVPLLLAQYPPDYMPESYTLHSEEEALIYVGMAWRGWLYEGAKDWLRRAKIR